MGECRNDYTKLPPGWDCKYDETTGNCYYINYFTKAMQLEDPRMRYKQLQNEISSVDSIPMQPLHGSPYHVYPTSNFPAVKAFQAPCTGLQSISASPLLSLKSQYQMEMSPVTRHGSPNTPRNGNLSRRSTIQETSFTNPIDTDAVVANIQNMFPTAGENHIRLLLKKYYNREAVVISALQVEKHPVTMPGPFVTPPSQRHLFHSNSAFQMTPPARRLDIASRTSRTTSPIPGGRFGSVMSVHSNGLYGSPRIGEQIRNSPKPHSSPKMKLRYMKTIFPKADETLLLDILANSDNNVQKASEKLTSMGYIKRDFVAPKVSNREDEAKQREKRAAEAKIIPLRPKEYTHEEKEKIKKRLQDKYKIAERIISMALESVNFSEDRAIQILQIVQEEEESRAKKNSITIKDLSDINNAANSGLQTVDESLKDQTSTKVLTKDTDCKLAVVVTQAQTQIKGNSIIITKPPSCTSLKDSTSPNSSKKKTNELQRPETETNPANEPGNYCDEALLHQTDKNLAEAESSISPSQNSIPSSSEYPSTDTTAAIGSQKFEKLSRSRDKSDSLKNTPRGSTEDDTDILNKSEFKSIVGRITAMGHNSELAKGSDDNLLLADYVTWNGANPDISTVRKNTAVGPDPNILSERSKTSLGRNKEFCKGPNIGLAKGSIYAQLNKTASNIKCN